ncbi:MAG: ABC transporter permease, partial [Verrucomicrobiota bacterium]|nr:ABC transporter permease [Verrucomicrobiota bacterium]
MNDLRFALRQLLKSPGFTILTVMTLALGIGMNTAIFSLVNDLFLHGLPFQEPSRIVSLQAEAKDRNLEQLPMSVPRFWHFRDGQTVFSEIAADAGTGYNMTGMGDPVQLNGANMTANYFHLLGVKPIRGRLFQPQEEMAADVALVSANFWRNRLGSDPQVVGRGITLNGVATTIVGVIPNMPVTWWGPNAGFARAGAFADRATLSSLGLQSDVARRDDRRAGFDCAPGLLAPGAPRDFGRPDSSTPHRMNERRCARVRGARASRALVAASGRDRLGLFQLSLEEKVREGGTPSPARETRALPGLLRNAFPS